MKLHVLLTAKTNTGVKEDVLLVSVGPELDLPIEVNDETRERLHRFLDYSLGEIAKAAAKSLPFLPEKVEGQPQHLVTARQWLNLIESGKQKARCTAWESEDGIRHILMETVKG